MNPSPPSRDSVASRMTVITAALVPVLVVECVVRGAAWVIALLSGLVLALAIAWLARRARGEIRAPFPAELDVAVVALLIALLLPAGSTWISACLAVALAMLLGRLAFGGLGQALFNPAMVGLAVTSLMFSGTADASTWSEWAAPAAWLGGGLLLLRGIVAWQIPLAFFVGALAATAFLMQPIDSPSLAALAVASHPAWVLCAFFIAGDSTTGCLHARARFAFGLGCGLLVVALDHWQPAFGLPMAMLVMSFVAPWLDQVLAMPRRKVLSP